MRLDPKALAFVSAALWGSSVLAIGFVNLSTPPYGREFLEVLSSVSPGYTAERSIEAVLIGTGYALVEGAGVGWLAAFLYNRLVKKDQSD